MIQIVEDDDIGICNKTILAKQYFDSFMISKDHYVKLLHVNKSLKLIFSTTN